jgi:predicted N-formylglutamate amidohydrolase
LLACGDPSPVIVTNAGGASPFLLLGDHAGRLVPAGLGGLGLDPSAMDLHIALDIGVARLGERVAEMLDACFIRQAYSRLVIDCNRAPDNPTSIPAVSDGVTIPGNQGLTPDQARARRDEILHPYQQAIAAELDRRAAAGQVVSLVSLHSFTPVMDGFARPWRTGVLHRNDSALSSRMLTLLRAAMGELAGDNEPYRLDERDYTVPLHADARGLDYLELEVRQDLLADEAGVEAMAALLAPLFVKAAARPRN